MTPYEARVVFSFPSSLDELKSKYRALVKQYHPDICKTSECVKKFMEVQEAYELLLKQGFDNSSVYKQKRIDFTLEEYIYNIPKEFEGIKIYPQNLMQTLKLNGITYDIKINVIARHPYVFENNKVFKIINLPYIYFLVGGKIGVEFLDTKFALTLPSGLKNGQTIKIVKKLPVPIYLKFNVDLTINGEEKFLNEIKERFYKNQIF